MRDLAERQLARVVVDVVDAETAARVVEEDVARDLSARRTSTRRPSFFQQRNLRPERKWPRRTRTCVRIDAPSDNPAIAMTILRPSPVSTVLHRAVRRDLERIAGDLLPGLR
jgi:hypothetical protein